jgi:hypothetical protein
MMTGADRSSGSFSVSMVLGSVIQNKYAVQYHQLRQRVLQRGQVPDLSPHLH